MLQYHGTSCPGTSAAPHLSQLLDHGKHFAKRVKRVWLFVQLSHICDRSCCSMGGGSRGGSMGGRWVAVAVAAWVVVAVIAWVAVAVIAGMTAWVAAAVTACAA